MKLYSFQPNGHGQLSFFVMAESKENAIAFVDKYIMENNLKDRYETDGWGTDYYECTATDAGAVVINDNI